MIDVFDDVAIFLMIHILCEAIVDLRDARTDARNLKIQIRLIPKVENHADVLKKPKKIRLRQIRVKKHRKPDPLLLSLHANAYIRKPCSMADTFEHF